MGILLGLAAALLYGSSDFGGGLLSRRLGLVRVTVIGSAAAAALAWAVLIISAGPGPSVPAVAWGLASGLAGGAGTLMLYRGLARGQMSVVGPVSAVGAAVVPATAGIAMGERPSAASRSRRLGRPARHRARRGQRLRARQARRRPDRRPRRRPGFRHLAHRSRAGRTAGLWPVASEQTGTLLPVLAVAVKSRQPLRIPVRAAGLPALAGASGMAATLAYFYAAHFSMLAVAAVLVSLYPGVTVLLARLMLHERFSPAQRAGLGLCALAIIAIALN